MHMDSRLPQITHTTTVSFKKSKFTGHAAAVESVSEALLVVTSLRRAQCCVPYAYRVHLSASDRKEGASDDGDIGFGDKLLHLLKRWDVENVILAVSRDDSASIVGGNFLGVRRFKVAMDCAKSVIQLCYLNAQSRLDASPVDSCQVISPPEKQACKDRVVQRSKPFRHDSVDLMSSLPVDDCGQDRVSPRGQVNNFRQAATGHKLGVPKLRLQNRFLEQSDAPAAVQMSRENDPPQLSAAQRSELRYIRHPPRQVELVLRCVCALCDSPLWLWAGEPAAVITSQLDWVDVRTALTDLQLNAKLKSLKPQTLNPELLRNISVMLRAGDLGPKSFDMIRAKSVLAAYFFSWIWMCLTVHGTSNPLGRQNVELRPHGPHYSPASPRANKMPTSQRQRILIDEKSPRANVELAAKGRPLIVPSNSHDRTRIGVRVMASPAPDVIST